MIELIILPFAGIKKAQYFGLELDSFFTLTIQLDEYGIFLAGEKSALLGNFLRQLNQINVPMRPVTPSRR